MWSHKAAVKQHSAYVHPFLWHKSPAGRTSDVRWLPPLQVARNKSVSVVGINPPSDKSPAPTGTECRCRGAQKKYVMQMHDAHLAARMRAFLTVLGQWIWKAETKYRLSSLFILTKNKIFSDLVWTVPRGIEPLFSPWEGDVLTAWPRNHTVYQIYYEIEQFLGESNPCFRRERATS